MKKLSKDTKFLIAIIIAALIIAAIIVGVIMSSRSDVGKGNKESSNVSSETNSGDGSDLSAGEAVYDKNDGTIHDSLLVYEVIKDAKTPEMKVSSYYDINREKMEIPSKVTYDGKEYTVTVIGKSAFESNTAMEEVIIPDTVKRIEANAFYSNAVLAKVTLSDSVSDIGISAFAEDSELKEVKFGKGLKSLGDEVFSDCTGLESMSIPGTIESMGKSLFYGCENMTKFEFGDGITVVGDEIFTNCYKLADVTIPESVVSIGKEAFWGCEKLKSVTLPSRIAVCGEGAFYSCGIEELIIKSSALQPSLEMLDGCDTLKKLKVPEALVNTYKSCYEDADFTVEADK